MEQERAVTASIGLRGTGGLANGEIRFRETQEEKNRPGPCSYNADKLRKNVTSV
jgi:hypothetical protein